MEQHLFYALAKGEVSHFHRLKSDEVWYYHDGNALTIYMIDEAGKLTAAKLGTWKREKSRRYWFQRE